MGLCKLRFSVCWELHHSVTNVEICHSYIIGMDNFEWWKSRLGFNTRIRYFSKEWSDSGYTKKDGMYLTKEERELRDICI